ncbi:hypothetical protein MWN33_05595 [Starkeya koreensis]|uniref:DUF4089 domain-containing protein n=1 Tax=Ancylobacter koreensis TaxID=266121 RepID=A0ABT0DJY7_9HYPH|nr:hypothetical protein [Ancylobacter koreensis]MCK0207504.1 hypothetical protein [Ancylobacter koreensis]
MYEVSEEYVRAALAFQGVPVPPDELRNVHLRLSLWMKALNEIEAVLGEQMNDVDPIPPVYPQEEF